MLLKRRAEERFIPSLRAPSAWRSRHERPLRVADSASQVTDEAVPTQIVFVTELPS